jgi:hypothetical protein
VKVCSVCLQPKARSEFLCVTKTAVRRQCKPCWRAIERERFQRAHLANPTAAGVRVKKWLDTGDNRARIQVAWRASAKVNWAIKKGRIVRPNRCEGCGKACKPDGAHYDYSQPFNVRWLCRSCHVIWDHSNPKTRRPSVEAAA